MTRESYDVIVAGLGAMGSATVCHLAMRGRRVLGLDRWSPGHTHGSSHGDSRIIREMYFEAPTYVPIVQRAYELWRDLEARTGRALLRETGGLLMGPADGEVVAGSRASAEHFGIPHELLGPAEVRRRFPAFELPEDETAVLDPRAGYLDPEACNAAHLDVARRHGAILRFDEPVLSWQADGDGVQVRTPHGRYLADRLVVSVGARARALLSGIEFPLTVERQVLWWFEPDASDRRFDPASFPVYIYGASRTQTCYGFPRLARGVKAAVMHKGEAVDDADAVRRSVEPSEVAPLRDVLARVLPALAAAPVRESGVCLFANTPDLDFVIDAHPSHPQVLISSPCSGHGFKFASAIGELQADLLTTGSSRFDLSMFRLGRFETDATAARR